MTNPNDNAFPWDDVGPHPGLTKREYFVAKIAASLVAAGKEPRINGRDFKLEEAAVLIADALIVELSKETTK